MSDFHLHPHHHDHHEEEHFTNSHEALLYSACVTLICLFIFGYFKSKATGQSPWPGALKVALIGTLAASAAYGVAKLFGA